MKLTLDLLRKEGTLRYNGEGATQIEGIVYQYMLFDHKGKTVWFIDVADNRGSWVIKVVNEQPINIKTAAEELIINLFDGRYLKK